MELLEVGKGCGRGCRFCLEGQVYRPVRHRSLDSLRASVAEIAKNGGKRVGLVGACVSDYPWIGDLMKMLDEYGVEVSISSLRADSLTEDLVASLQRGGHRTLTMAPEAGTERLREVTRKVISDEQLFAACDLLRRYGIPNLKCYFMIGLPTETREDVEAIPDLAERMLERLRVPGPDGHPVRQAHAVDVLVRAEAVDAVSVGAVRRRPRALEEKLEIIKRGARRLSRPRRAREPAGGGPPGPPRPRRPPTGGLHRAGGRARRRLAPRAPRVGRRSRRSTRAVRDARRRPCPGITSTSGVKKAGLLREWQRAGLGEPAAVSGPSWPRVRIGQTAGEVPAGEGRVVEADGRRRSRSSTWTAPSTPSTMAARTGAVRSGEGDLDGTLVACPWHGWRWDVDERRQRQ